MSVGQLQWPMQFKIYLDYAAKVCSLLTLDWKFKTVGFDVEYLSHAFFLYKKL